MKGDIEIRISGHGVYKANIWIMVHEMIFKQDIHLPGLPLQILIDGVEVPKPGEMEDET